MRSSTAMTVLIWLLASFSVASSLQVRTVDTTQLRSLPQCATRCLSSVLPSFDCKIAAPCFCDDNGLSKAFNSCLDSGCATLRDQLDAQRFYAESCNTPVRSRGTLTRAVVWSLFSLAAIFLAARILSRWSRLNGRGYSWDDFVVLFCFAMLVPFSVSFEYETRDGLGQDAYRSSVEQISELLHWYFAAELLYVSIVILAKIAVVLLYLRIWTIESTKPGFRLVCLITIAILVFTVLAFDFALIFRCSPVDSAWNGVKTGDSICLNIDPLMYTFGALDILYDIVVFVLPLQSVWALALSWKNRIGISSIFLVGLAVTASAAVRLSYQIRYDVNTNVTWNLQYVAMWSFVEAALSIVCTCMPAIVGLAQRMMNGDIRDSDDFMAMENSSGPQRQNSHHEKGLVDRSSAGSSPLEARDGMAYNEQALSQLTEEDESPYDDQHQHADFGEISIVRDEPVIGSVSTSSALPERSVVRSRHLKNQAKPLSALHYRSRVSGSPKRVQITHDPPSTPSEAKMTYRDENDILHEVTITDIPQERPPGPFHSNWRNGATRPRAMRAITEVECKRNSRLSGGDMMGPRPTGSEIFAAFRALPPVSAQMRSDPADSSPRNDSSSPGEEAESSSGYVSAQDLHSPSSRSRSASTQTGDALASTSSISRGRSPGDAAHVPPPVLVRNPSSTQTEDTRSPLSPMSPSARSGSTQTSAVTRNTSRSGSTQTDILPRKTSRSGFTQTDDLPRKSSRSGSTQTDDVPRKTSRSGSTQTDSVPRKSSRSGSTQTDNIPRNSSRSGSTQTEILPGLLPSPRTASRSGSTQTDEVHWLGSIATIRRESRGRATQTDEMPSRANSSMSPESAYTSPESSSDTLPHPVVRTVPSGTGSIVSAKRREKEPAYEPDRGMPMPASPTSPMSPMEESLTPESSNDALPPPIARTSWH